MISTPSKSAPPGQAVQAGARPRDKDRPSPFFEAARVSSVGLEMAVATGIGWGLGYWLDGQFGTDPYLMLAGLLCGVAAGFKGLIDAAQSARRNQREED